MRRTSCENGSEPRFSDKVEFKVAIIYEDRAAGQRAIGAFRCLNEHLENDFELRNNLWSFELLRIPKIRDLASRDMASADMIIVSAHGHEDLPTEIRTWMQKCLPRKKSHGGALVALFDSADENVSISPALLFLKEIADRARLDFFSHGAQLPGSRFNSSVDLDPPKKIGGSARATRPPSVESPRF